MPLATDVTVTQVAILQGVQIPIAMHGAKVSSRKADVVAGRAALVRVYVSPKSSSSPHSVTGELTLESSAGTQTFSATLIVSSSSSDALLSSTMNFDIPDDAIHVDSKYSVSIYDSSASGGDTSGARYPASGSDSLDARETGTLKLVIVPIAYNFDHTGRLPDTSAAQIETYRKQFHGMYPAKKVDVSVRAPYAYSGKIEPNGAGIAQALMAMETLRASDHVANDVYYWGAFANAASYNDYCLAGPGGKCSTGLCIVQPSPSDPVHRACVGIGFGGVAGSLSATTAAHEIGHAHGRLHAPCGALGDLDPSFPYTNGAIGVYGYDLDTKSLYSPSMYNDIMGYCHPKWISDYTFRGLLNRMAFVNAHPYEVSLAEPQTYRYVVVAADGSLAWGDTIQLSEPPQGTPRTVTWEDASGKVAGTVTGSFNPFDHLDGGFILVPEAPKTIATVRIGDARLPSP